MCVCVCEGGCLCVRVVLVCAGGRVFVCVCVCEGGCVWGRPRAVSNGGLSESSLCS